jgi:heme A synthase
MMTQDELWIVAGAAALVALLAAIADWRRDRRRELDRVGWVPWGFLQFAGMLGAVVAAALAVKMGG